MIASGSLLDGLPATPLADERFDELLRRGGLRLVRIVSTGQATPAEAWYDQDEDEWVVVVRGRARLMIEGETAARDLGEGDWVLLPAHCRHRVDWTDPGQPTVWLALHLG